MQQGRRKQWSAPQIQKYGTFEQQTLECDKMLGGEDGFTFMGQAIVCAS